MYEAVEFPSENATLRGRLYNKDTPGKKPVIILTHGYSANFGISDGEPRQQLSRWLQARGYRDPINFVSTLEVDGGHFGIIHYPNPLFEEIQPVVINR